MMTERELLLERAERLHEVRTAISQELTVRRRANRRQNPDFAGMNDLELNRAMGRLHSQIEEIMGYIN